MIIPGTNENIILKKLKLKKLIKSKKKLTIVDIKSLLITSLSKKDITTKNTKLTQKIRTNRK